MSIQIDPEIANLCRPLTDEEKAQLEANLQRDGCIEKLKLWDDVLIDGHNRREICDRLGIPYETEPVKSVNTKEDAIRWVITNQLGRRNLIPEDVSYLRGKRYEAEKLPVGHPPGVNPLNNNEQKLGQNGPINNDTSSRLGKELGVGASTVKRDAVFAAAVDKIGETLGKDVADMIRTGQSGISKVAIGKFAKEDDMTIERFNDLRYEQKQQRARPRRGGRKREPKAPLTQMKKVSSATDPRVIDRMRQFMNALDHVAKSPVTAAALSRDPWPPNWRQHVVECVPTVQEYLASFMKEFSNGTT